MNNIIIRIALTTIVLICLSRLSAYTQVVINEYSASNLSHIADNYDKYEDWMELYNKNNFNINIGGYFLSDDTDEPLKWKFPAENIMLPSGGHIVIWLSGRDESASGHFHSNFKLTQTKENAEWLILSDASGILLEQFQIEITQKDHSRGRINDGANEWGVFTNPTPGTDNDNAEFFVGYAEKPTVNVDGGFYDDELDVIISTTEPNAVIRYTIDGTEPASTSTLYSEPVNIPITRILKARVFSNNTNILPGLIEFNTYLIDENHELPVVSIAGTNMTELLNGDAALRPEGSFEFFNLEKERTTAGYGEFNEHGQDSWVHPQRSIDYITRDEAGYSAELHEKFFSLSDREDFQRLIIRAAGDDNYPGIDSSAHLRDDLVQTLSQKSGQQLDWRKSSRIVVYANGQFWGIYALREKVNDHDYTDYYYGQDKYDLQFLMLWGGSWAEYGGEKAFEDWYELHDFIMTHDMGNTLNYQAVTNQFDITSLVDYIIINSYVVCSDWLNWNVGWWRGMNPEGGHKKWAYILWDEDATFGHYYNYTGIPEQTPYISPCFPEGITEQWQDPEGHIAILNKLRENPVFEQYYVSRYIDLMNTTFNDEYMLGLLDSMAAVIAPEMPAHVARWGGSVSRWQINVEKIRNFITERNKILDEGLKVCYGLTGPYDIYVDLQPAGSGQVKINSLELNQFPWEGKYFGGIDVLLEAVESNQQFEFDHWTAKNHTIISGDTTLKVSLSLIMEDTIIAVFRPKSFNDSLVINEINYNSAEEFDPGDWVEFYNPQVYALDISGWKFRDEQDDHVFAFPVGTMIEPEGYLVLTRDSAAFSNLFPDILNFIGDMDFGLSSNGELIRLYNHEDVLVDTVHFLSVDPWPVNPNGQGPTLELTNPELDNALAENWTASALHGTPGEPNGSFVFIPDIPKEDKLNCKIYPNPFNESATIQIEKTGSLEGFSISIYNVFGQKVGYFENLTSNQVLLSRNGLPSGIYFYLLTNRSGRVLFKEKFVIN